MVDPLFVNDESTALADCFDESVVMAFTPWTLDRAGPRLDILVEARFVDVSSCRRSHYVSGTRWFGVPLTH